MYESILSSGHGGISMICRSLSRGISSNLVGRRYSRDISSGGTHGLRRSEESLSVVFRCLGLFLEGNNDDSSETFRFFSFLPSSLVRISRMLSSDEAKVVTGEGAAAMDAIMDELALFLRPLLRY